MTTRRFEPRRLPDGRAMANLGCSARVATNWNNIDFSWLLRIARFPKFCAFLNRVGLLSEARYTRIQALDGSMLVWDLRKGIPFADATFDVVYHSHVLEHIDRSAVPAFLAECRRVLAPGGVLRIVVPDLEVLARRYVTALDAIDNDANRVIREDAVVAMIDQMIVRTPTYRAEQPSVVRALEHVLIGNTERGGILHRWMYDRASLHGLLLECGFLSPAVRSPQSSQIGGWRSFLLDEERDGSPYKLDSLYIEAIRG